MSLYDDVQPLREILHRMLVRYLTVRPHGFEVAPGDRPQPTIEARILGYGSARTLYQQKKPHCRSLDGIRSITEERTCADCKLRSQCTPQVRLDLVVDGNAFRLLLAYTSARNFFVYEARLRQRGLAVEQLLHRIRVANRGSWGELHFSEVD